MDGHDEHTDRRLGNPAPAEFGEFGTDVLGEPYQAATLRLAPDREGEVVATLVRRRCPQPTDRAVLYVHGFVDYFFQTWLADWYVAQGFHFYALDLRKCGRSMLEHQTPHHATDLAEYFPELDAAVQLVRDRDGVTTLLANGHSTGGLTLSLWAHHRRERALVDGLFLNSPFLDLNASALVRAVAGPLVDVVGARAPLARLPFGLNELYARTIHSSQEGAWDYDLALKPLKPWPVRAGWLRAIRRAQRELHAGLSVACPVLVTASTGSSNPTRWDERMRSTDAILDVEQIARWSTRIGPLVTTVRIPDGMHDVFLSPEPVQAVAKQELARWVDCYLGKG